MTEIMPHPDQIAAQLKAMYPLYRPKIGIVLGSGLGGFVDNLENRVEIPYQELSGFPISTVHGHAGKLVFGTLGGKDIVCLQGRAHLYEGANHAAVKMYVRTLHRLGCEYFIATNAVGSLNQDIQPGELMLITDHINFQSSNPLVGPNEEEFGPRFLAVDEAYYLPLREQFLQAAKELEITLHQGIYFAVLGPSYETAAEIRAFRLLGADVVGMSTVPEVLVAHHCGMKVGVISTITNFATGLNTTQHDHNEVVKMAAKGGEKLNRLLSHWLQTRRD
ncbi:MAG TPA: purine-nucleoside phosphorylase [Legionellaceae bacterium]|nr:purine-nucleoside phosphorylase [Legionellaceae bacterium]